MSPESIRNRFLGSKREFTEKELQHLTELDGLNHYALGIEERNGQSRGIAVIRLVRSSEVDTEAEVAITVIDEYQKMGLGGFLLDLIKLAAIEREIERLSFTYLPQNTAIPRLLQKAGSPQLGTRNRDYVQLYLDLFRKEVDNLKSKLSPVLPEIEKFSLS